LFAWMWSTSSFCTFSFPTEGIPCAPLFTIVGYIIPGYSPPHGSYINDHIKCLLFLFDFISHRSSNIVEFAPVLEFEKCVTKFVLFFVSSLTFSVLI
jgi:hypothetical protein